MQKKSEHGTVWSLEIPALGHFTVQEENSQAQYHKNIVLDNCLDSKKLHWSNQMNSLKTQTSNFNSNPHLIQRNWF